MGRDCFSTHVTFGETQTIEDSKSRSTESYLRAAGRCTSHRRRDRKWMVTAYRCAFGGNSFSGRPDRRFNGAPRLPQSGCSLRRPRRVGRGGPPTPACCSTHDGCRAPRALMAPAGPRCRAHGHLHEEGGKRAGHSASYGAISAAGGALGLCSAASSPRKQSCRWNLLVSTRCARGSRAMGASLVLTRSRAYGRLGALELLRRPGAITYTVGLVASLRL